MKKIFLILIIATFLTILIYNHFGTKKHIVISLGDSLALSSSFYGVDGYSFNNFLADYYREKKLLKNFNSTFCQKDQSIEKLIMNIENNLEVNDITIQQAIKKSTILTVSIGTDELITIANSKKITNSIKKDFYSKFTNLLNLISELKPQKVIVVGLYSKQLNDLKSINKNMEIISKNHNYQFLDISSLNFDEDCFYQQSSYLLNYHGHEKIFFKLKNIL